jgi:hypothetical protein
MITETKSIYDTKPPQEKILQSILHTENESKQNHKRVGSIEP